MDAILGLLLRLPGSPLRRSPGWASARRGGARKAGLISRYWACALREAWEETGLRPPGIRFLGCLPMYRLVLFRRAILPLVGWVEGPRRFRLNWEVERLVPIPLSDFLDPRRYARYRLDTGGVTGNELAQPHCYPCFRPRQDGQEDVLWGATYHIAISFLERAFAFRPPPEASRPVISGTLAPDYATGSGR